MARTATPTRLSILCFGDSLTAGFPAAQPYAGKLAESIEEAFPSRSVQPEVEGVPGDRVVGGDYLRRMKRMWADQSRYDWTIVLGGTNDLAWGVEPSDVVDGLIKTWDIALKHGSKVLALTIPETKYRSPQLTARRDEVNKAIMDYRAPNFFHFDLHAAMPYHSLPGQERARLWEPDGVHLTDQGYDVMGERIGACLSRILALAEAQETGLLDDAEGGIGGLPLEELALLEEERGDPRLLSQGYIVVRKADLE